MNLLYGYVRIFKFKKIQDRDIMEKVCYGFILGQTVDYMMFSIGIKSVLLVRAGLWYECFCCIFCL